MWNDTISLFFMFVFMGIVGKGKKPHKEDESDNVDSLQDDGSVKYVIFRTIHRILQAHISTSDSTDSQESKNDKLLISQELQVIYYWKKN